MMDILMPEQQWARLLAYVTGLVNQKLCSKMSISQPRIASSEPTFPPRCAFPIPSGSTLAEIGQRLAELHFSRVACVAKPDTILAGTAGSLPANSTAPNSVLHPVVPASPPQSKRSWSASPERTPVGDTDRIVGGSPISATSFRSDGGQHPRRYGIQPAPKPSQNTTWKISSPPTCRPGRYDFFTVEVLTWRGLATYYVLFFIHLESRRVSLAGLTRHPLPNGCCRWLATPPMTVPAASAASGTFFMIETPSFAPLFWM